MSDLSNADKSVERPASTADQFSAHPELFTKLPQATVGETNMVQSILEAVQKSTDEVNELKKNKAQALDRPKRKLADTEPERHPTKLPRPGPSHADSESEVTQRMKLGQGTMWRMTSELT